MAGCTSCGHAPIKCWCVDCNEALCRGCVTAHRRVTVTRTHTLVIEPPRDLVPVAPTKFCPLHPSESLQLFCFSCNRSTCRDCQLLSHRNHRYEFTSKAMKRLRKLLNSLLEPLRTQMESSSKSIDAMEKRLSYLSQFEATMERKLQKHFLTIAMLLKKRLEHINKIIKGVSRVEREQISARILNAQRLQQSCMSVTAAAEEAQNTEDLLELIRFTQQIKPKVEKLAEQDPSPPPTMAHVKMYNDKKHVESFLNIGKFELSWIPFSVQDIPKMDEQSPPVSPSLGASDLTLSLIGGTPIVSSPLPYAVATTTRPTSLNSASPPLTTMSTSLNSAYPPLTTMSTSLNSASQFLTTTSASLNSTSPPLTTMSTSLNSASRFLTTTSASLNSTSPPLATRPTSLNSASPPLTTMSTSLNSASQFLTTMSTSLNSASQFLTTTLASLNSTSPPLATMSTSLNSASPLLTTMSTSLNSASPPLTTMSTSLNSASPPLSTMSTSLNSASPPLTALSVPPSTIAPTASSSALSATLPQSLFNNAPCSVSSTQRGGTHKTSSSTNKAASATPSFHSAAPSTLSSTSPSHYSNLPTFSLVEQNASASSLLFYSVTPVILLHGVPDEPSFPTVHGVAHPTSLPSLSNVTSFTSSSLPGVPQTDFPESCKVLPTTFSSSIQAVVPAPYGVVQASSSSSSASVAAPHIHAPSLRVALATTFSAPLNDAAPEASLSLHPTASDTSSLPRDKEDSILIHHLVNPCPVSTPPLCIDAFSPRDRESDKSTIDPQQRQTCPPPSELPEHHPKDTTPVPSSLPCVVVSESSSVSPALSETPLPEKTGATNCGKLINILSKSQLLSSGKLNHWVVKSSTVINQKHHKKTTQPGTSSSVIKPGEVNSKVAKRRRSGNTAESDEVWPKTTKCTRLADVDATASACAPSSPGSLTLPSSRSSPSPTLSPFPSQDSILLELSPTALHSPEQAVGSEMHNKPIKKVQRHPLITSLPLDEDAGTQVDMVNADPPNNLLNGNCPPQSDQHLPSPTSQMPKPPEEGDAHIPLEDSPQMPIIEMVTSLSMKTELPRAPDPRHSLEWELASEEWDSAGAPAEAVERELKTSLSGEALERPGSAEGKPLPPATQHLDLQQPKISLFRIPLSRTVNESSLPRFRLTQGEFEDEIYMDEIQDTPETPLNDSQESMFDDEIEAFSVVPPDVSSPSPQHDFNEPLSSPGSCMSVEIVSCCVCGSPDASNICFTCGRGYHRDCHIPAAEPDIWSEWICSLCQDPTKPIDSFESNETGLSLQDQRRCQALVLRLRVDSEARRSEFGFLEHILERLSGAGSPGFRSVSELVSQIWARLEDSAPGNRVADLQRIVQRALAETFGSELPAALPSALQQQQQQQQQQPPCASKLQLMSRLRDFLGTKPLPAETNRDYPR